jgi:hypothetical protein
MLNPSASPPWALWPSLLGLHLEPVNQAQPPPTSVSSSAAVLVTFNPLHSRLSCATAAPPRSPSSTRQTHEAFARVFLFTDHPLRFLLFFAVVTLPTPPSVIVVTHTFPSCRTRANRRRTPSPRGFGTIPLEVSTVLWLFLTMYDCLISLTAPVPAWT